MTTRRKCLTGKRHLGGVCLATELARVLRDKKLYWLDTLAQYRAFGEDVVECQEQADEYALSGHQSVVLAWVCALPLGTVRDAAGRLALDGWSGSVDELMVVAEAITS